MASQPVRRVVNNVNTLVLHGKDYVEVAERIRVVHQVKTDVEMVESEPREYAGRLLWRCVLKIDGKHYIGNAEVKLDAPKGSPDGTNPFECAETSAVGRALAFAGIGTVESIASYDEIARGKPFVREVENPQSVVDAGSSQQQIGQPQPQDAHKERLYAAYDRLVASGEIDKSLSNEAKIARFCQIASHCCNATITAVGQITASRLDVVESYSKKDARAMIAQAKGRVESIGMVWEDAKRDSGFGGVADNALTVQQVATINGIITQYEKKRNAA